MKYILQNKDIREDYLTSLLKERGITDINTFLKPSKEVLHNPELLLNMKEGAEELNRVLAMENPKIGIVVDSDQDGDTSAAIMWLYLMDIKPELELEYFIHKGKQHGLEDMEHLLDKHFDLIILPDASSNDYSYHKEFKEAGTSILVIDHHEAEKLSEDAIVINNQLSPDYPNKALSGAGMVYKFCQYLDTMNKTLYAYKYIDLAAVGIIGDMMSTITPENRYIIKNGLSNITNPFLKELIQRQAFSIGDITNITPTHISFYITPLVNALIRVGNNDEKSIMFDAFIDGDKMVQSTKRGNKPGQFESLAEQAARTCINARSRQNRTKEKAMDYFDMQIQSNGIDENKIIIVDVGDYEVESTLTGLIAMQIQAKYKKPVIVARENSEGFLRGSARGDSKSELPNLKDFFSESGYFEYAEGHQSAHGVSIEKKKLESFINYSNEVLKDTNFNEGVYNIDFLRSINDKDIVELVLTLGEFPELWGKDNEEPYLVIENIEIDKKDLQVMGRYMDTLKFEKNGLTFIQFHAKEIIKKLEEEPGNSINITILGRASINEWMGKKSPQIIIQDYNLGKTSSIFDF